MKPEPLWQAARPKRFGRLRKICQFDVVVIGGGLTGLSAAYHLKRAGKKVCLLERDRLGFVDTGLTTAHLTYVTDLRPAQLAKTFGDDAAKAVLKAGATAIDTIESVVHAESIDCDFRRVPGYLCSPFFEDKEDRKRLEQDANAAKRLGFPARFQETIPFTKRCGVRFPDQATFHPLKYLAGLAAAVQGDGSEIFDSAEVKEIQDEPLCVIVNRKRVEAEYVVISTHVPLMGKAGLVASTLFQSKIFSYSSYAIGAKIPRGSVPEACFWDTSNPYYYLRIEPGKSKDYAIFGGEDHKTGQQQDTPARFNKLAAAIQELIPGAEPDRQWSGQVVETNDGLPYIGETAPNQFVATGFSGNGMTFGTIAALMARDAALGRKNPWKSLFSVNRKKLRGGVWNYVTENLDFPYYYVKDRLVGAEGTTTRQVQPGEGKILNIGDEKVACSRDERGKLHSVSAYCTHMGCIVRWNRAEQTWDCPCHGSRFQSNGDVLAGPAEAPLEPAEHQPRKVKSTSVRKKTRTKTVQAGKKTSGQSETQKRPR